MCPGPRRGGSREGGLAWRCLRPVLGAEAADLIAAIAADLAAQAMFDLLTKTNASLSSIGSTAVKRAQTRERKISQL